MRLSRFGNRITQYCWCWIGAWLLLPIASMAAGQAEQPSYAEQLIFPLEHWHNHASCVVEAPNGDLLACWFHGSGERQADDVKIEGARLRLHARKWDSRFTLADTPGYPDTNPALLIDPHQRLWLFWPAILANRWETALMKYRVSEDYQRPGPPRWKFNEVMHLIPRQGFTDAVQQHIARIRQELPSFPAEEQPKAEKFLKDLDGMSQDKLSQRLGWMTRAHPMVLGQQRLIVPLYSDGFDFSLMAITDDWGNHWHTSLPLTGLGNIQPSIVRRKDGGLFTLMRDNGPPPHRLHQSISMDQGETWSPVTDSSQPNPGSGAEIIGLRNGHWVLIGNDTEAGRHSLAVQISEDEGQSWPWKRHIKLDPSGTEAGSYHYPSLIQSRDGSLHATFSYHLNRPGVALDADGQPARKSIMHAHFNEAWIRQGDCK